MAVPRVVHPRTWALHLVALVAVGAAVTLGLWQYDAWGAQRAAEARDVTTGEPVPLEDVLGPDDPFPGDRVGQPVLLAGTWVPEATVYVSGREYAGRDGFWAATPLAVAGAEGAAGAAGPALFVVRGWTETPDRAPAPPRGEAEVVAWLQPTEGTGQQDDDRGDDVLPQMRTADLVQRLDQDLYGAYAVLDQARSDAGPATAGLQPASLEQLPEAGQLTALRNLLYAVEWWLFGLFAAFIWWRWVREDLLAEPVDPVAAEPVDA